MANKCSPSAACLILARRGDRQIVLSPRGIKDTGLVEGDKWLFKIATQARQAGFPVILDRGEGLFPPDYPMRHAAFYFGWYTGDVSGPMARPGFKFTQGAVAVHIHSFSAASMRDPKRSWCAPLLAAGAALSSVAPTSKSAVSRRERTSDLEVGATGDRSASTPRIVS